MQRTRSIKESLANKRVGGAPSESWLSRLTTPMALAITGPSARTMSKTEGAQDETCEAASPLHVFPREPGTTLSDLAIYLPSATSDSAPQYHRIVAACGGSSLPIYCSGTLARVGSLACPGAAKVVAYCLPPESGDLPRLAVRQHQGLITFFDGDDFQPLHSEQYGIRTPANCLMTYAAPGPEGDSKIQTSSPRIAVGTLDGEVQIIDGGSYQLLRSFRDVWENVVEMDVYGAGGARPLLVAGGQAGEMTIFDPESGERLQSLDSELPG
jgi:hypothetical protein